MADDDAAAIPPPTERQPPPPIQPNAQQDDDDDDAKKPKPAKPKRIIRRRRRSQKQQQDDDYPIDPVLLQKVLDASNLPVHAYRFEIEKTVRRCVALQCKRVALQLPEGLLLYATALADVLRQLVPRLEQVSVLGDTTYGACCVDDLAAQQLDCQLLVHYGHSCLVPLQHTVIPVLYVFVEIQIEVPHLVDCLAATLLENEEQEKQRETEREKAAAADNDDDDNDNSSSLQMTTTIYLLGTVQFRHALATARELLRARLPELLQQDYSVELPQVKPLSPGEVLGCTSPVLDTSQNNAIVCFVADGRFHLESMLIANPHIGEQFYRYDPYSRTLTRESYDHAQMHRLRRDAIQRARSTGRVFGVILGTLGRQGNPAIVQRLRQALHRAHKRHFVLLLSEITPAKLQLLEDSVDVWVQVACPRLSVDWGHYLSLNRRPVLNAYECMVCLGETEYTDAYPMDYYSQAGGPWSNYHGDNRDRQLLRNAWNDNEAGVAAKGESNKEKK